MVKVRKVSKKQEALNNEMNKIKRELPDRCCICGRPAVDPAHLLPRSMYPEYYGGNECVSIEGYCEEKHYDSFREADEWELSDDNPNHYKPTCIAEEPWWNEVKDREIKEWNIIGGGMYKVELWIDLEE